MTPAARWAATIEILDEVFEGVAAEKALTNWTRRSRFAGSKDRAAVRDQVFDALRQKLSCAALGGGESGRLVALGLMRKSGLEADELFSGIGHAPAELEDEERTGGGKPEGLEALDWPQWLKDELKSTSFDQICQALQSRAPIFARVNLRKATVEEAVHALAEEEIDAEPFPVSPTALLITRNPRRIKNSIAYKDGLIELQDAASQAVVDMVPLTEDMRVLDYCAGGGGKVLAMAGRVQANYFAYDINDARMKDLPQRAMRAGIDVQILTSDEVQDSAPYDVVFVDAPCSGSGAWRRAPEGKWALTPDRLNELCAIQQEILQGVAGRVAAGGTLVYVTCSMFERENGKQIDAFLSQNSGWSCAESRQYLPLADEGIAADGFFCALLTREA